MLAFQQRRARALPPIPVKWLKGGTAAWTGMGMPLLERIQQDGTGRFVTSHQELSAS